MRDRYTVKELCDALEVSASGYYKSRQTGPAPRHEANQKLLCEMRYIHADRHTRCYGSPRMTRELRARGLPCSENLVQRSSN
jgi:putative transposase